MKLSIAVASCKYKFYSSSMDMTIYPATFHVRFIDTRSTIYHERVSRFINALHRILLGVSFNQENYAV